MGKGWNGDSKKEGTSYSTVLSLTFCSFRPLRKAHDETNWRRTGLQKTRTSSIRKKEMRYTDGQGVTFLTTLEVSFDLEVLEGNFIKQVINVSTTGLRRLCERARTMETKTGIFDCNSSDLTQKKDRGGHSSRAPKKKGKYPAVRKPRARVPSEKKKLEENNI